MTTSTQITATPPVTTVSTSGNTDNWKNRRRFMLAITGFDMAVTLIALLAARTESVAQIAIIMAFSSLTAIFGFYVAGATWDDHSIRQFQLKGLALAGAQGGASDPSARGGDQHGP